MKKIPDRGDYRSDMRHHMRDRSDANRLWGALLPTYRVHAAGQVRDLTPLIDALRNPRAVEMVAARLARAAVGRKEAA